ncbi:MAG: hypothetical protein J7497_12095, partial [Chitinophagaceae bacterium]|nr:hypothetical protein [Chitinophagaceae bacterium]
VENRQLVLLCLPNEKKTRFQNARNDFFKLVNDLNNTGHSKEKNTAGSSFKSFTAEYRQEHNRWTIEPLMPNKLRHIANENYYRSEGFTGIPAQPPRA